MLPAARHADEYTRREYVRRSAARQVSIINAVRWLDAQNPILNSLPQGHTGG